MATIYEVHDLKCWLSYFFDIQRGAKNFEIRRNDRHYQVGDVLRLREWMLDQQHYTGRQISVLVKYITDFEQKPGFVVMGISPLL